MIKKVWAVLSARNIEFIRDHAGLLWSFLFPILVIFGFAFMSSGDNQAMFKVVLFGGKMDPFAQTQYVQFISDMDLETALGKLKRHQIDMVVRETTPEKRDYWINSSSPKGYLLEKILRSETPAHSPIIFEKQTVIGKEIRYVDWLISGLLAMNMMFSALFGVGYNIVRYRKNGVLKRLKATPLTAFEFLLAQVLSRLILILGSTIAIYAGAHAFLRFQMLGSYFNLFLVFTAGAMCLISLSLMLASRTESEEFAGGLLNAISWPMMFLSGVWFSLEGAYPWVKKLALIFPLTHVTEAARAIMTEGAGLSIIAPNLITLAGMSIGFLAIGSHAFKWK